MSITLSIKQIRGLAIFAGIAINEEMSVYQGDHEQLETELTIESKCQVKMENGSVYTGQGVYFSEYPEEGTMPLEEVNNCNTKAPGAAESEKE